MKDATVALALASITFLLTVIWGGPFIEVLRRLKIGKQIRVEEPSHHQLKMGTPTMGGLLIVVPVLAITALINVVNVVRGTFVGRSVLLPLAVLTAFTLLGAYDDWLGLKGVTRGEGMRGRSLIVWQTVLALAATAVLYWPLGIDVLFLPSVPFPLHLPLWVYFPVAWYVITGASNSVNLTDGLDSLAGLISATAFAGYGVIALWQGQVFLSQFCFILVGAVFAFLWFNAHPAQMIMGGSASYSLGAALGIVALMTGQWLLLPLMAFIPISVALSVAIQVLYFKLTRRLTGEGKRVFKMAPLHRHFELLGWSEPQVVQRFWLVQLLAVMVGVGLALL